MYEVAQRRINPVKRGSGNCPAAVERKLLARIIREIDGDADPSLGPFAEYRSLASHCPRSRKCCCRHHRAVQSTVLNLLDGLHRSDRLDMPIHELLRRELRILGLHGFRKTQESKQYGSQGDLRASWL